MHEGSPGRDSTLLEHARRAGISRKDFMRLSALGGAGAVLGTVAPGARTAQAQAPMRLFFKADYAEYFHKPWSTELGSRWFDFNTFITPVERFFVRNRYASPGVNLPTWRLKVTGDAIEVPMELTYDDLLQLPARHAIRYVECFGNARTLNWEQLGYEVQGGNWGFGDISQGEWEYVPIVEILDRVKVRADAKQLLFWSGVDGPDTGRPMPIEEVKARQDVIGLAYGLNGSPLHPDHGGPVRALVPGWGGAASVKWLTEIRISSKRFWTRMHTKEEALVGPTYQAEAHAPDDEWRGVTARDVRGIGGTWQNVKSFLTLPLVMRKHDPPKDYVLQKGEVPALPAGPRTLRGYAFSPYGIQKVDVSADGGRTWRPATLVPPLDLDYAWVRFELPWDARPGTHVLMTKATDKRGNTQPETIPMNEMGILCNVMPKFEVRVG
jgi:DMSO/TMAO reductase YedYZ molybdopterin-dependent catalytic subunit